MMMLTNGAKSGDTSRSTRIVRKRCCNSGSNSGAKDNLILICPMLHNIEAIMTGKFRDTFVYFDLADIILSNMLYYLGLCVIPQ